MKADPLPDMEDVTSPAAAIEQHLRALVAQGEQQRRLQAESDRLDELLLVANTLLITKKLIHFAAAKKQQPFPLTLALLPALPSLPASSVSLSLTVTNRTAIPLCTPASLCTVVLNCHTRDLPSGCCTSHVYSFPPSLPLFLPTTSFTHRICIPLISSSPHCSLRGEVELHYHLDEAAQEQPTGKQHEHDGHRVGRIVTLRLAEFELSAADLCQHTNGSPTPSLSARARGLLLAHPSSHPPPAASLPPQLDRFFSLSTFAEPHLPPSSSAEFAIAFLSLAMSSAAASPAASSLTSTLLSSLFPPAVSSVRDKAAGRAASVAPVVSWRYSGGDVRLQIEARRLPVCSSPVPFLRVRCSSSQLLPTVHAHVFERIAHFLSSHNATAGAAVASALRYEERKALLATLFDDHVAPLSNKQAELLSQLRLTQQQLQALLVQQSSLTAAEVQLLSVRLLHRVSALYRYSRQLLRASQLSGLDEAILVV